MVAFDQPRELCTPLPVEHSITTIDERFGHRGDRRGNEIDGKPFRTRAEFRARVRKQDRSVCVDGLSAGAKELHQLLGRLKQLLTGRAPSTIGERTLLYKVAVAVELFKPPPVAQTAHACIAMLDLDRDQPLRAEEQVVDLPRAILIAAEESPLISEHLAEVFSDELLAFDPGPDLGLLGELAGARRW